MCSMGVAVADDAAGEVVVDKSGGLQEGVADCRAEKLESSFLHVLAYGVGQWR